MVLRAGFVWRIQWDFPSAEKRHPRKEFSTEH